MIFCEVFTNTETYNGNKFCWVSILLNLKKMSMNWKKAKFTRLEPGGCFTCIIPSSVCTHVCLTRLIPSLASFSRLCVSVIPLGMFTARQLGEDYLTVCFLSPLLLLLLTWLGCTWLVTASPAWSWLTEFNWNTLLPTIHLDCWGRLPTIIHLLLIQDRRPPTMHCDYCSRY